MPWRQFARALLLLALLACSMRARAEAQPTSSGANPSEPGSPGAPTPAELPGPAGPTPIQPPPSPYLTPLTPPATTLPPWTPPASPPPSQTNLPTPVPVSLPGTPALGGHPGGPALSLPGAFAPTTATVRGATLELRPTARLAEEYSDNFFQTARQRQDNFRTTLGPGLDVVLNGARALGAGSIGLDLVHDTADDSGNTIKLFPSLTANLRYAFTPRLSLSLTESFTRNDEPSTVDQFGIRSGRQTFDTNTFGLSLDWLLDQVATQAYYRNVLFFNEGRDRRAARSGETTDSITNIFGVNATAKIAIDYAVRVGYEFSHTHNLDQDRGGLNSDDNTTNTGFASVSRPLGPFASVGLSTTYSYQTDDHTRTWNASVLGTYGLPGSVSLSGSIGYSLLNSDTEDSEGTVSLNLNATYSPTPKLAISVGMFRDFAQTAQQGQNFGTVEAQAYFGRLSYQVTPLVTASLNVTYRVNQGTGTGNVRTDDTETTLTAGASLNWQILRWLVATLSYTFTKETGQRVFSPQAGILGDGGYTENRVRLSLFASF